MYVGSNDGKLYAFNASGCGSMSCTPQWTGSTGGSEAAWIAVAKGVAYVESTDGRLYAFPAGGCASTTCSPLWSAPVGQIGPALPSVANGVVFVGSEDWDVVCRERRRLRFDELLADLVKDARRTDFHRPPRSPTEWCSLATNSGTLYAFGLPAPSP